MTGLFHFSMVFSRTIQQIFILGFCFCFCLAKWCSIYEYTTHFVNPFICWYTFGLFPPFDYHEQCCCIHWCTDGLVPTFSSFIYLEIDDYMFNFLRNLISFYGDQNWKLQIRFVCYFNKSDWKELLVAQTPSPGQSIKIWWMFTRLYVLS